MSLGFLWTFYFAGPLILWLVIYPKKILSGVCYWFELVFAVWWLGAHFFSMEATRAAVGCVQGGEVVAGSEPPQEALAPLPHGILALLPRVDEENPQRGSEMNPPRAVPS